MLARTRPSARENAHRFEQPVGLPFRQRHVLRPVVLRGRPSPRPPASADDVGLPLLAQADFDLLVPGADVNVTEPDRVQPAERRPRPVARVSFFVNACRRSNCSNCTSCSPRTSTGRTTTRTHERGRVVPRRAARRSPGPGRGRGWRKAERIEEGSRRVVCPPLYRIAKPYCPNLWGGCPVSLRADEIFHRPTLEAPENRLLERESVAPIAQLAEQLTLNQRVVGSSPTRGTYFNHLHFVLKDHHFQHFLRTIVYGGRSISCTSRFDGRDGFDRPTKAVPGGRPRRSDARAAMGRWAVARRGGRAVRRERPCRSTVESLAGAGAAHLAESGQVGKALGGTPLPAVGFPEALPVLRLRGPAGLGRRPRREREAGAARPGRPARLVRPAVRRPVGHGRPTINGHDRLLLTEESSCLIPSLGG